MDSTIYFKDIVPVLTLDFYIGKACQRQINRKVTQERHGNRYNRAVNVILADFIKKTKKKV